MTPEEAQAAWDATPATTPEEDQLGFAEHIFAVDPDYPRAVRVRHDDGRRNGVWTEVVCYDPPEALEVVKEFDGVADIYIIPNPLGFIPGRETPMATDADIKRIRFLPIDLDSKHLDHDMGKTAEELEQVVVYLGSRRAVIGFTGNGYLVLESIHERNDEASAQQRSRFLNAIREHWSTVDVSTYNAARLVRFLGTMNMSFESAGKDGVPKRSRLITPIVNGLRLL